MCKEIAKDDEIVLELSPNAGLSEFWAATIARFPDLKRYKEVSRVAINQIYAKSDDVLKENDEVCIIPPVSGG